MKKLRKYLQLCWAFFVVSVAADIEFRINFILQFITDIFWYGAQAITFEVIYRQTPLLGSWHVEETRFFLGILFFVDAIYMILFSQNIDSFSEKIRLGSLDLLLTKPVNSQFMLSVQRFSIANFGNLIVALIWLFWSLSHLHVTFTIEHILWFSMLVPCGLAILYCIRFNFAATSLIFTRADNLQYLWYQVYKLGTRPDSMYQPWLKLLILTAVPVGFIASVPARAILDPPNYLLFLWSFVITTICLLVTRWFWHYALRHYTSASS